MSSKLKPACLSTWPSEFRFSAALAVRTLIIFWGWAHSLNTESSSVRAKIAGHANDLISLGVDGLRVDAAKRMVFYKFLSAPQYQSFTQMSPLLQCKHW